MEPEAVTAFRQKMGQEKAKAIYKLRGAVAEFPNAWLKDKINLWKFRLRGLAKVTIDCAGSTRKEAASDALKKG